MKQKKLKTDHRSLKGEGGAGSGPEGRFPRGISSELLISQVKNTVPYLFISPVESGASLIVKEGVSGNDFKKQRNHPLVRLFFSLVEHPEPLSHVEYFKLCVCSHFITCATPVPTDVDIQIRKKLWPKGLPWEWVEEMVQFVLHLSSMDWTDLTRRRVLRLEGEAGELLATEKRSLSGVDGEWFTIAAGAYCALNQYSEAKAARWKEALHLQIRKSVEAHSQLFGYAWRKGDGIGCLKASSVIAHNFGDLDRVMDMWELPALDPLRLEFHQATSKPFDPEKRLRYEGRLWVAGGLYQAPLVQKNSIAHENHRHFSLRKPRVLRQHPDLMIQTGPFLEDWGREVTRLILIEGGQQEDWFEVLRALQEGWLRLPGTQGYGRAIQGMLEGAGALRKPAEAWNASASLRVWMEADEAAYREQWNQRALEWMDEAPSRAK